MEINLDLARKIVTSFVVSSEEHPEFMETIEKGEITCKRNHLVSQAMEAIDNLKKSL